MYYSLFVGHFVDNMKRVFYFEIVIYSKTLVMIDAQYNVNTYIRTYTT